MRNWNEAFAGIFLILVALLAWWLLRPLSSDTEVGLGPGYLPRSFAAILAGIGGLMLVFATRKAGEPPQPWRMRPLVLVLGAVSFFALTVERLGLAVALTGLILIGSLADRENRFLSSALLAAGVTLFSVLVFVKALGLTLRVWPLP